MISVRDYPTNGTLKTVISYVSQLWLNDDMDDIQLAAFSVRRQDRTATSGNTVVLTAILHSSFACEADDHTVSPFIKGCAYYWPTSVRAHNICNRIGMHAAPWHVTVY